MDACFADGGFKESRGIVGCSIKITKFAHHGHALTKATERRATCIFLWGFDVEQVDDDGGKQYSDACCGEILDKIGLVKTLGNGGDGRSGPSNIASRDIKELRRDILRMLWGSHRNHHCSGARLRRGQYLRTM